MDEVLDYLKEEYGIEMKRDEDGDPVFTEDMPLYNVVTAAMVLGQHAGQFAAYDVADGKEVAVSIDSYIA